MYRRWRNDEVNGVEGDPRRVRCVVFKFDLTLTFRISKGGWWRNLSGAGPTPHKLDSVIRYCVMATRGNPTRSVQKLNVVWIQMRMGS